MSGALSHRDSAYQHAQEGPHEKGMRGDLVMKSQHCVYAQPEIPINRAKV